MSALLVAAAAISASEAVKMLSAGAKLAIVVYKVARAGK